jgi:SagB-type dehydrogenase family enzyme
MEYHLHTSYDRYKMTPHSLDWSNQPSVYKQYQGVTPFFLPRETLLSEKMLSAVLSRKSERNPISDMDLNTLSAILRYTDSLTAKSPHSGFEFYYRTVASAGALYPTEVYLTSRDVTGLDNGLYHFAIHHHGLIPLRSEDVSAYPVHLSRISHSETPMLRFFMSAILFRSSWKYRERAYRYHLLDTGHLIENLILALNAFETPFDLFYDFDDDRVHRLLGIDGSREVALALVDIPGQEPFAENAQQEIRPLTDNILQASQVAPQEIRYRAISEMHGAGNLSGQETPSKKPVIHDLGTTPKTWVKIASRHEWAEVMGFSETIFARRSRRNFVERLMPAEALAALLTALCEEGSESPPGVPSYHESVCIGFLAGRVENMASGFYLLNISKRHFGLVAAGDFMGSMAHICLGQSWAAHAAVHFLFLANLQALDSTWGARGYRYAMLTSGRLGQRLYVASTAMGLGCCGIGAFFDGEAANLLGLNKESRVLYVVALGPIKSKRT